MISKVPTPALQRVQRELVALVDAAQFTEEANAPWVKWAKLAAANMLAELMLRERYPDPEAERL